MSEGEEGEKEEELDEGEEVHYFEWVVIFQRALLVFNGGF